MADSAESQIRISVQTSADTAALAAAGVKTEELAAAVKRLETTSPAAADAVKNLQTHVAAAAQSQGKLSEGTDKATTSTRNSGMAMLTTGRAVQDLQYGIGGVLNNIEGLVVSLGGTAGLAGVLTLVGVGLSLLVPMLTKSGEEADKLAEEQKKLVEETTRAAAAADREAASMARATAAGRTHEETLEALTKKYAGLNAEIQERLRREAALRNAESGAADAQSGLEMAEVDAAEKKGVIGPQEAEKRRAQIETEAMKRRQKADNEAGAKAEAAAGETADNKSQEAAGKFRERANRKALGQGLLTEAEQAQEEANIKNRKAEAEAAATRSAAAQKELADFEREKANSSNEELNISPAQRERAEENKRIIKEADEKEAWSREEARKSKAKLDTHNAAKERTNLPNRDALDKDSDARQAEIDKLEKEAAELKRGAETSREVRGIKNKESETRQKTREVQRDTRVGELDEKDAETREKRAQEQRQASEKRGADGKKQAAKEFADVARAGRAHGASESGLNQLEAAFKGMLEGDAAKGKEFSRLLALLAPKLANDRKEIDELKAAVEALRSGH